MYVLYIIFSIRDSSICDISICSWLYFIRH